MYVYVLFMCLVPEETKKASDPLELGLQTVASFHVGAGT